MQGDTGERILQSANELLIYRGYAAFSYADIADAVKIRKASIHHHFPTKAGLVVAVLRAHRVRISKAMEALDTRVGDPLLRIKNYFQYWEGCIRDHTVPFCVGALMGAEMPALPGEVQAEVRLHFSMLTEWFERTLEAGAAARTVNLQGTVAEEAQTLIALLHGGMVSARATGSSEVFRMVTQPVLNRLSAAAP